MEVTNPQLREMIERVAAMTDEEIAQAVLAINATASLHHSTSSRQTFERELIRDTKEDLIASGQYEEVMKSLGFDPTKLSRVGKRKQIRVNLGALNDTATD